MEDKFSSLLYSRHRDFCFHLETLLSFPSLSFLYLPPLSPANSYQLSRSGVTSKSEKSFWILKVGSALTRGYAYPCQRKHLLHSQNCLGSEWFLLDYRLQEDRSHVVLFTIIPLTYKMVPEMFTQKILVKSPDVPLPPPHHFSITFHT